ncbi:MAG TPA: dipicolinate synthase subunit B [Feifaniaceae bacterium]|nr:dipicolinate synthase subunit B [Feifaniaceae bacterium]
MNNLRIGYALTGSFCTLEEALKEMRALKDAGANITPIVSFAVAATDTRFGAASYFYDRIVEITGREPIATIEDAEPIGPKKLLDVVVIAPCTGNTLAKLANAVTDTPVTMAAKAHLRNKKPVVIAISTNDGLSANAKNLGILLNARNVYFVPFGQDNPIGKSNSLVADYTKLLPTIEQAMLGEQIEPILLRG